MLTDAANIQNLNVVETLVENPSFSGTRNGVVVGTFGGNPALVLGSSGLFDSTAGLFDAAAGLFDAGVGTSVTEGTYQFSDIIDLGQRYTSRVSALVDVRRLSSLTGFDETPGLFDSTPGLFDGDGEEVDETRVQVQVSYTDDDPASSPSWSPWMNFFVTDISARAFRFRVVMESFVDDVSPAVVALSVSVDMPDRVESGNDVVFTGSTTITFPSPFNNVPALGVSVANLSSGQRYAITSKTRLGFTINVLNSDGSPGVNSVSMDYVAKGYGRGM